MKNFKTIRNICLIVLSVLACTAVINLVRINATAGGNASATVKPLSSATNTVCTHKNEKILLSRAATCTQTGWTQGKECADCGELLLPQTTIAALGHTEEYVNEVKATCTQTGNTSGTKCTVCGVMTGPGGKELPIDPTNHQIRTVYGWYLDTLKTYEEKAPTCENEGNRAGDYCDQCKQSYNGYEKIPALGGTCAFLYGSCTTCGGTDPDPAQNPTSLKIDGITLLRDTELNIQKLTDGYGTITGYRIKFIEKADGTEWTAEDTDNPNVVRIDYTIKPTNYYTKKARYWYDESYEGTRFIVDEEQGTITFLKSGSLNVIVVSDNDTTIRDDVSIYWNTDEEWEEMTS